MFNKSLYTILMLIILAFNPAISLAKEEPGIEEVFPKMFNNEQEAVKHGAKIVFLKGKNQKSCVMKNLEIAYQIAVYDQNAKGQFIKADSFCFPLSHPERTSLEFQDLLGNEQQFMIIKFEVGSGTGAQLCIALMIIGWRNNRFVPVLAEPILDWHGELGYRRELEGQYSFENLNTPQVSINLTYKYMASNAYDPYYKFETTWKERLPWNSKNYSFYNAMTEWGMLNHGPLFVRKNLAKIRLSLENTKLPNNCGDDLDKFFKKTRLGEVHDENLWRGK